MPYEPGGGRVGPSTTVRGMLNDVKCACPFVSYVMRYSIPIKKNCRLGLKAFILQSMETSGVVSSFLMPHPPILVPSVGKGREGLAKRTIQACRLVAGLIGKDKPAAIVIISPHAPLYRDYTFVYPPSVTQGSFQRFGAADATITVRVDASLQGEVMTELTREGLPCGSGQTPPEFDHGVLVPLYFLSELLPSVGLVALSQATGSPDRALVQGRAIARAAKAAGKRVCVIGSGDMSHRVNEESPYGASPDGPRFDKAIVRAFERDDAESLLSLDETSCEQAAECGFRSIIALLGVFENPRLELISYEAPFGIGYCVGRVSATP